MRAQEFVTEAFDQPYKGKWEKSEYGDVDLNTKLPDGTNLSIMFNNQQDDEGQKVVQVEFYRNNSQEVTGEGDAQRIFATVLNAIQKYIKKYKPSKLSFSASKATDPTIYYEPDQPQPNPESRAKLYDRLVQRYARAWGYQASRADNGDLVIYELSRLKQGVAEGLDDNGISFQVQKGKNKFATTLSVGGYPVGVYQYDANTGRSIAEIYPEFKGKGLGKLLVLHAIYTAANLGLDFQEDESRTSEYDNVLDCLSSNGYIVDDDGYWYVTSQGEQYLQQSLKQDVAEDHHNDTAISLSKLGKFHPGADTLAEFVPERATARYALHPDKWESTFYSLTNKDSDKLKYYGPKKISIPPGTLVGDMAIANKFYRAKTPEEQEQYAELYKASLKPYPVDVSEYRMPELLIPKHGVAEQQLDELSFLGSECTKDCSGHRAGYEWSKRKGLRQANSLYSPSFNKGAALAVAGK